MRRPPEESRYLQKRREEGGAYYAIVDRRAQLLATSCLFRNETWCAIGFELMLHVPSADLAVEEELELRYGKKLGGFSGILIRRNGDRSGFHFEFITNTGKKLLTSVDFPPRRAAERAADRLRDIVRSIARENPAEDPCERLMGVAAGKKCVRELAQAFE